MGKLDPIKIKKTFVRQRTLVRVKEQLIEWEKIFSSHIFDKG
jgi:hypothetical protein